VFIAFVGPTPLPGNALSHRQSDSGQPVSRRRRGGAFCASCLETLRSAGFWLAARPHFCPRVPDAGTPRQASVPARHRRAFEFIDRAALHQAEDRGSTRPSTDQGSRLTPLAPSPGRESWVGKPRIRPGEGEQGAVRPGCSYRGRSPRMFLPGVGDLVGSCVCRLGNGKRIADHWDSPRGSK